jgi:hypothetical protein
MNNSKAEYIFAAVMITATIVLVIMATGCATNGGKQDAGRTIHGNPETNNLVVTISRDFDSDTGMLTNETTTISNAVSVVERDKSRLGAKAFFANKAIKGAKNSRTGFVGSTSNTGIDSITDDVAEEGMKAVGDVVRDSVLAYFSAGSSEVLKAIASATSVRELSPETVDRAIEEVSGDPRRPAGAVDDLVNLRNSLPARE